MTLYLGQVMTYAEYAARKAELLRPESETGGSKRKRPRQEEPKAVEPSALARLLPGHCSCM